MLGAKNPKDSNIYRKLVSRLTYDSIRSRTRYECSSFYKYVIPSGLVFAEVLQVTNSSFLERAMNKSKNVKKGDKTIFIIFAGKEKINKYFN